MSIRVVTFGEIMGRIASPGFLRFSQALPGMAEFTFGGGEANVAVSLAGFGLDAAFVTALPRNAIADACVADLRRLGVDTSAILRTDAGRLGLYYLETGANQRPSNVTYDRAGSAISVTQGEAYDWDRVFTGADWFHVTGITPAISAEAADAALLAVKSAKHAGLTVSCDLNFRKKLWEWRPGTSQRELAEETMRQLLVSADVVIGNEEDAEKVLGIAAEGTDVESGELDIQAYVAVARRIVGEFPNVASVGITLRQSISATHNNWGGMLYDAESDQAHFAPLDDEERYSPYEIRSIVDRVGGGDAFAAGLIFASVTAELAALQTRIRFAVAASCLKHSITGDFNIVTRAEAEKLMSGQASGRVNR